MKTEGDGNNEQNSVGVKLRADQEQMNRVAALTGYPSIDKPWLKYFREEDLDEPLPKCTVYQSVYKNNKDYPKDAAINFFGNKISYGKLFLNIDKCTKSLRQIGIKRGDCVTLCTAGVPEAIYIVLACSRIGAIANFINPLFTKEQMIERINETDAGWIFVLDKMYRFIGEALDKTCVENVVIIPVTNSVAPVAAKILWFRSKARGILKEKHIGKTYYSYTEFVQKGSSYIGFSTGIVLSVIMPLAHGVCVIPEPLFSKESFAKDLMKYRPTLTLTATSLWLYVATAEETKKIDLSKMTYPSTGGEKISEKDEHMLNDFLKAHGCKVPLLKGYGMCELGSEVTGTTAADGYQAKIGSTGYPILNSIVSAFDILTDEELPYGKHGEIRVCTPARMKGYYKNPAATEAFFKTDAQGRVWGCTGDIGYVDEDGEVFILGRTTDCCRHENGKMIYFFDIEDVILKDDAVNQCKVVDTEINGKNVLVGHIVLRDEGDDEEAVLKRIDGNLKARLPEYMVPDYYKLRSSMPVHSNGKRDVGALKKEKDGLIKVS